MTLMNVATKIAKNSYKFYRAHKSTLCIGCGLAAGGAALYSGCKATAKSVRQIDIANNEREINGDDPLTKKEVFQLVGKNYISTGAWTLVSAGLIIAGHRLDIKAVGVATAAAKESDNAYNALRDSVNDILSEDKDTKDKIIDRYEERKHEIYGDSLQPIDQYHTYPGYSKNIVTTSHNYERFKDEYGFECWSSRTAIKAAKDKFKLEAINDIEDATLADFYYDIEGYDSNIIRQPEYSHRKGYNTNVICDFDIRFNPDYDADGLFWTIDYDLEPVDVK